MEFDATATVIVGLQSLVTAVVGIHVFLIRRTFTSIDERAKEHEQRILHLERETVNKEEWLREIGMNRQTLHAIHKRLDHHAGSEEAIVQLATAIAEAIRRRQQDDDIAVERKAEP